MRVVAILTAAGSGTRLGHPVPKALVHVGGVPLVALAARGLVASGVVDEIVVTVPAEHQAEFAAALTHAPVDLADVPLRLVVGGATRQASVAAGLVGLDQDVDVVLVHDAARALAPADLVVRVVEAVRSGHRVVVPGLAVTDSLVEVVDGVRPFDRRRLRTVQTPQGFDRALLERAHEAGAATAHDEVTAATDDASLCAALGEVVTVVDGSDEAFKVTTRRDLAMAEALVAEVGR